jgi:histidinol-phosphate aminotransferase
VVDEAYLPFCDSPPDLLPLLPSGRLVLLRSMTKDYGLAGLRLGYTVAVPYLAGALQRVRPPWNVSAASQAAGLAALDEEEHVRQGRRAAAEARDYLTGELASLGLRVVPSAANFILARVGDGAAFRSALMERGVCVRDCASFGLPAYVRVGMRPLPECQRLVDAVRGVIAGA